MRRPWRLPFQLGADDLVDVEEAVLLEADLDERGLHAGEDVVDDALVDVAGDRAAAGPLEVDLGEPVVLDDGDALLGHVHRDEELALRGGERLAPRLAAAWLRPPGALGRPGGLRGCRRRAAFLAGFLSGAAVSAACVVVVRLRPFPPRLPRRRRRRAASWPSAAAVSVSATAGSGRAVSFCSGGVFHGWTPSRNAEYGVGTMAMASGFSFVETRAAPTSVEVGVDARSAFRLLNCMNKPRNQGSSADRRARFAGAGLTSGGGRPELRTAGAEGAETLVEAGPGPRLDLSVTRHRLVPRRLQVLEPGVRLLDLEQLLRFANRPGEGVVVIVHGRECRTRIGRRV